MFMFIYGIIALIITCKDTPTSCFQQTRFNEIFPVEDQGEHNVRRTHSEQVLIAT